MAGAVLPLLLLLLADTAFDRGAALYGDRKYVEAIPLLEQALQSDLTEAQRAEALLLLGQSYYSLQRYVDAIPPLEKRRRLADRLEVQFMLGTAYVQTRQPERSREAFASMFDLRSDSQGARLVNAQMMVRNGFEAEAEQEIAPALASDQPVPGLHQLAGELALHRGDTAGAVQHLEKELVVSPGSATALYKLGDAYTRRGEWEAAVAPLQKSIWLNPYHSGPYILLGKVYQRTKSLANAEGMLRRALQLDPQNRSAHYLLGQVLMQAGKTDEGRRLLQRFRELEQ
jgi:tetratricopeptide (TPR) repeat protein